MDLLICYVANIAFSACKVKDWGMLILKSHDACEGAGNRRILLYDWIGFFMTLLWHWSDLWWASWWAGPGCPWE